MVTEKLKKKSVPKHIVVVDTNRLWEHDKSGVASEIFEKFWLENSKEYTLELFIPEVVKGELLYQHTTSALKALDRANTSFNNASKVAAKKYSHSITPNKVKKDVEAKINKWLKSKNSMLLKLPQLTLTGMLL